VLHELQPKGITASYSRLWRNCWPFKKYFGDPPNFHYDDPVTGEKKSCLLRVQAAREPSDYIWMHLYALVPTPNRSDRCHAFVLAHVAPLTRR
jgi:hypothetical protein